MINRTHRDSVCEQKGYNDKAYPGKTKEGIGKVSIQQEDHDLIKRCNVSEQSDSFFSF